MRSVIGIVIVVWLLIGVLAAWQRGYFGDDELNCSSASDTALTVVAGPLNYLGVNPKVECEDVDVNLPEPSQ